MTHDETRECLVLITGTYPNLTLTKATLEAWQTLLEDLPGNVVKQAVVQVLRQQTGSWWPTPGSVRQEAMRLLHGDWPSVDQAWGQVVSAIRQYGYMRPAEALEHLDPPVAQVVRSLGWQDICEAEPGIIRGQFVKFYTDARSTAIHHQAAQPLIPVEGKENPRREALSAWLSGFGRGSRSESPVGALAGISGNTLRAKVGENDA